MWKPSQIRALALAVSLLLAAGAPAQIKRETSANRKLGEHGLNGSTLFTGSVAAYFPGQETVSGPWATPGTNMLLQAEDLTTGWNANLGASIDDATHASFTQQYSNVQQGLVTSVGQKLTFYIRARAVTGNTALSYSHVNSASGDTTDSLNLTGTVTDYAITVLGRVGGGEVLFGIQDRNASGFGQIEVTRFAVIPGTWTAAECAAIYQSTTTKQAIPDWSGRGNTAYRGTNANVETSDGTWAVRSRNLLAPGSATDLTNAAWNISDGVSGLTTTSVTLADEGNYYNSPTLPIPIGSAFVGAATLSGSGVIGLKILGSGGAFSTCQAITLSGTPTRYSVSGTAIAVGTIAYLGLENRGALCAGVSNNPATITATNWQLEQVPSGASASPYTDPAEPVVMGWDAVTDDLITGAATLPANWTFTTVLRPDDNTSVGLWQNGTNGQKVSLDANGKVAYTNGVDTVTSTAAIPAGLWSIISVVNNAGTITHYLNGAANGSAAASGASNAFTALRIGTDGTTFFDGQLAGFIVHNTAKTGPQELAKANRMATDFWNRRAFRTAITDVTNAPLYAWLQEVREILWARLLPVPGGVR